MRDQDWLRFFKEGGLRTGITRCAVAVRRASRLASMSARQVHADSRDTDSAPHERGDAIDTARLEALALSTAVPDAGIAGYPLSDLLAACEGRYDPPDAATTNDGTVTACERRSLKPVYNIGLDS